MDRGEDTAVSLIEAMGVWLVARCSVCRGNASISFIDRGREVFLCYFCWNEKTAADRDRPGCGRTPKVA
jgi:hypothetical protein